MGKGLPQGSLELLREEAREKRLLLQGEYPGGDVHGPKCTTRSGREVRAGERYLGLVPKMAKLTV